SLDPLLLRSRRNGRSASARARRASPRALAIGASIVFKPEPTYPRVGACTPATNARSEFFIDAGEACRGSAKLQVARFRALEGGRGWPAACCSSGTSLLRGDRNEAVQACFDNDGGGTDPGVWARRARHRVRRRVGDHPNPVELPGQLRRRLRLRPRLQRAA